MTIQSRTFLILAMSALLLGDQLVLAQASRTGSHLNANASPAQVMRLNQPDEIENIRALLTQGRESEALRAAERYIEELEKTALVQETLPRYYAYNALCTVLASLGRLEEAIASCTTAMEFEPSKWSAVNNRGTARLVGGQLAEALEDYERALSLAPEGNQPVSETIRHNIRLTEERQGLILD